VRTWNLTMKLVCVFHIRKYFTDLNEIFFGSRPVISFRLRSLYPRESFLRYLLGIKLGRTSSLDVALKKKFRPCLGLNSGRPDSIQSTLGFTYWAILYHLFGILWKLCGY
jgi:hypothetical protein